MIPFKSRYTVLALLCFALVNCNDSEKYKKQLEDKTTQLTQLQKEVTNLKDKSAKQKAELDALQTTDLAKCLKDVVSARSEILSDKQKLLALKIEIASARAEIARDKAEIARDKAEIARLTK